MFLSARTSRTKILLPLWLCVWLGAWLAGAPPALAQFTAVAPGVDYGEFTESGPNRVFVTRMERTETSVTIDAMIAQGTLSGGRETVSQMVSRYDQSIGYWGQQWGGRYEVVAAINGGFFDLNSGVPEAGLIQSGWYSWRYGDMGGRSGFGWTLNRQAFIGHCIHHRPNTNFVTYPDSTTQAIADVNKPAGSDSLVIYTSHYDARTPPRSTGVEVLVEMDRPTMILPDPAQAEGTVVAVRPNQGETPLPFDHIVLSASGNAAATLQARVGPGDRIGISQEFATYEADCSTASGLDWSKTYAGVGGNFVFLDGGVIQSTSDPGLTVRNPRTAVALDADYVFFIVVDGRSTQSVGMTMSELGSFCLSALGAQDGVNYDGGGSSALWVDGTVRNNPSDGSERPVANGLMIVRVHPRDLSPTYLGGDTVSTTASADLRLGPGTHHASLQSVTSGEQGTILGHTAAGVLAKGTHWWRVAFPGGTGWVSEASLQLESRDPDAGLPPDLDGGTTQDDGSVPGPDASAGDAGAEGDSGAVGDGGAVDASAEGDGGTGDRGASSGCACHIGDAPSHGAPGWLLILFVLIGYNRWWRRGSDTCGKRRCAP